MDQSRVTPSKRKSGHKAKRNRKKKRSPKSNPEPSCVSMKSDRSMGEAPNLTTEPTRKQQMQSSESKPEPNREAPNLTTEPNHQTQGSSEYSASCLSMKSERSKGESPNFELSEPDWNQTSEIPSDQHLKDLNSIFKLLHENISTFVKAELRKFYTMLNTEYPKCSEHLENDKVENSNRELFLKITNNFLKTMKQGTLAENLQKRSELVLCQRKLKSNLQQKFQCVFEGIPKAGSPTLLNQIYTELYITEGGSSELNKEHEVRHIEIAFRKQGRPERKILSKDIFKGGTDGPFRTVLTQGVAGIGKTVLTQKFSLDWADGKANQDIQLLFPFTFRTLNVFKERKFSLVQLVHHFFSETKELCSFEDLPVVFILDGLDECRLPLDFSQTEALNDPTESSSVDVLLVNLIRGNLLPSARLWITTRPAAANHIPPVCVAMVTEVRGFTNSQKEQYFRQKFKNKKADTIISTIKKSRTLHTMCYMPVFCWITATVLEHVLKTRERGELPKTLTQMYIHYLVVQAKVKNIKYEGGSETDPHWSQETKKMVETLGKLAFEQLQKGNLIFYESDLIQCGLDPAAVSKNSGVFTQVFREELGLYQDKVYFFIHLSVQEFLAALHVHQTFFSTGHNLLADKPTTFLWLKHRFLGSSSLQFYQTAVDQALQSPNGHLDLFLRFLLGLSLPTNQNFLQDLLTQTGCSSQTNQETADYIKKKISEDVSAERSISLLHCLNELNDHSLVEQIQQHLSSGCLSKGGLSPAQWSALAFILLSSEEHLDKFELKKYSASEEALLRLLPVVKASNKALLNSCNLSERSCEALSSVLSSQNSQMKQLDLSNNDLKDSGLKMLRDGLNSCHCALVELRLVDCNLSEGSCEALSSVLSSQSCRLKELDLSRNDLKNSGLKRLCVGLKSPHCKLKILRLSKCLIAEEGCASLDSALRSNPSHLRDLDLSYNHTGDTGVKLLSALRKDHSCTVRLKPSGVQWLRPLTKYFCKVTFDLNTANAHLKLSENRKTVTYVKKEQLYPKNKNRFSHWHQLLCSTELSGRCYWEVEWSGDVSVTVSYKTIKRNGDSNQSLFGKNAQSWSLSCSEEHYNVCHNNQQTRLSLSPSSSSSGRVAVYVDCPAGTLSFYIVSSDQLIHLHTFNNTFTHTLVPGFKLKTKNSTVTLSDFTE